MDKKDFKDLKTFSAEKKKTEPVAVSSAQDNISAEYAVQTVARAKELLGKLQNLDEYEKKREKLDEAIQAEDYQYARQLCREMLELYPEGIVANYFDYYLEDQDAAIKAFMDEFGSDAAEKLKAATTEERLAILIARIAIPKKQFDRAYRGYCALKNTGKAKYIRYQQGEEALQAGKYEEALSFFTEAEDYRDAKQQVQYLQKAESAKKQFDAQVGEKKTYFKRKLELELPDQMREHAALRHKIDTSKYRYDPGMLYYIALAVMAVACVIMLFDNAECDMVYPYFIWGIAFAVALHVYEVWDFRLILSSLLAFALSCAIPFAKILSMQYLHGAWIGLAAGIGVTAVLVVRGIKRLIVTRKNEKMERQVRELEVNLCNRQERLRMALITQYKAEVGSEIIKQWMDKIPKYV